MLMVSGAVVTVVQGRHETAKAQLVAGESGT
jgi:hypothetical protein